MINATCLKYNSFRQKINLMNTYSGKSRVSDLGNGLLLVEEYFRDEPTVGQLIREYRDGY